MLLSVPLVYINVVRGGTSLASFPAVPAFLLQAKKVGTAGYEARAVSMGGYETVAKGMTSCTPLHLNPALSSASWLNKILCIFPHRFYAIIVVDTRQVQRDFLESPPDASQFDDAPRFDETERQPYYITAAWDDSTAVPSSFIIGNESTTVVDGTTYVNGRLRQGRQYAVFYRIEIVSDNAEVMWACSYYLSLMCPALTVFIYQCLLLFFLRVSW